MSGKTLSVEAYLENVSDDKKEAILKLREIILVNIPKGFEESFAYGMIAYVVPHSLYPKGYHCNPEQALPFVNLAAQKNFIAIYHMGIYMDPELLNWFTEEHAKRAKKKLDMGKSCIRYKKPEDIPYDLIAELFSKVSVDQYVNRYEKILNR